MGGAGMGLGGALVMLVLSLLFGGNIFSGGGDGGTVPGPTGGGAPGAVATSDGAVQETPEERKEVELVSFVLDDAQRMWSQIFQQMGQPYRDARLVLFRRAVQSGCGTAQSAMGPFYCPIDQKVYIDLGFYDELARRFGAPGDFAQAYVLAHELGHHVQKQLGTEARVRQLQEQRPDAANDLSVRLELQADCYAGIWGNSMARSGSTNRGLDPGDAEEGLQAAASVGDDRLQRQQTGSVHPESFTHGTSAQRMTWFKRGFTSGDPRNCDTFAGAI